MPRTMVKWKKHERDAIFPVALKLMQAEPGLPIYKAVHRAQEEAITDPARKRNVASMNLVPRELIERLKQATSGPAQPKEPEGVSLEEHQKLADELTATRAELALANEKLAHAEAEVRRLANLPTPAAVVQDFFAGILRTAFEKAQAVPGLKPQGFPAGPMREAVEFGALRPPPVGRAANVVLVGSKTHVGQFSRVFNGRASFNAWSDARLNTLAQLTRRADVIFCRAETTPNSAVEVIKGITNQFVRVPGNEQLFEDAIKTWLERQPLAS